MLGQAFESMGIPMWVFPVLIIGFIYAVVQLLNPKTAATKARRMVAEACMTAGEERLGMEREALEMVEDDPEGLIAVAQEAMQRGRHGLARQAVEQLESTGKKSLEARKLRDLIDGGSGGQPTRELVNIRELLEEGLITQARRRLDLAMGKWPNSDALKDMAQRVEQAEKEALADPTET